ncbi:putative metalloprotease [Trypanosoma cruzi]|nr:putative metalloprotease [Trypanosoma cruzi]
MFACLRSIYEEQTAPPSKPGLLPSPSTERRLRRAVFAAVSSSERRLTQLHEERERKSEGGVVAAEDRKSIERRLTQFIAHTVQDHLRAVKLESTLVSHSCKQQRNNEDGRDESAARAQAALLCSAEELAQLLWMNRTMALGATISALEGKCPANEALLEAVRQPAERRAPDVRETILCVRNSSPALRAVLLDGPMIAAGTHVEGGKEKDVIPMGDEDGDAETAPDHHLNPNPQSEAGVKRLRTGTEEASGLKGRRLGKRQPFALKVDGSLLRSFQDDPALPTVSPSWGNPINNNTIQQKQQPLETQREPEAVLQGEINLQATSQAKCQMKLGLDCGGKLSFAQAPAISSSHTSGVAPGPSPFTVGSEAPRLQPSFTSQSTAPPLFAIEQRPHPLPEGWLTDESVEKAPAEGVKRGINAREPRGGIRAVISKRRLDETGEAHAKVGGQNNGGFVTAGEQLVADVRAGRTAPSSLSLQRRTPALGLRRSSFTPPFQQQRQSTPPPKSDAPSATTGVSSATFVGEVLSSIHKNSTKGSHDSTTRGVRGGHGTAEDRDDSDSECSEFPASLLLPDGSVPPILKPLDPKLVTQVAMEILEHGAGAANVGWDDIAGLEHAKRSVEEAIVWPLRRPDLFVGLRDPPRGLLLFGPPGTGKTMIARAIANRAQCTFLNISASSLMSKWMGDGEKLVRCLFAVAVVKQPSVIFIDEIDSLLSMRGEGEMDSVRRIKTEFLVQLDGVATDRGDRVLLIGATNRPDELDEAARRRMEKRLYIPLPDGPARIELVKRLLHTMEAQQQQQQQQEQENHSEKGKVEKHTGYVVHALAEKDIAEVAASTAGYSGADLKQVCREAAMGPLREVTVRLTDVSLHDLRPIQRKDFVQALKRIRPSVGASEVMRYVDWNRQFGSFASQTDEATEEDAKEPVTAMQ